MKKINIAVVGASGLVGKTLVSILAERKFPINKLFLLASERSFGQQIKFGKKMVAIDLLDEFDFKTVDLAFFTAGASISSDYVPKAIESGCMVVDSSSLYRNKKDIPLIIPEVNLSDLAQVKQSRLVANPNCSTIQMLVALAPIHREFGIKRINVATYQAVTGAGNKGLEELSKQTIDLLNFDKVKTNVFSKQIAFNVIPHIDDFDDNGYSKEEMKMVNETKKILDSAIAINPTTVRVPVFYGHSEAVHVELTSQCNVEKIRKLLKSAPGVKVIESKSKDNYPTAIAEGSGKDLVYVGRIRKDISMDNGLNLWIVADNVRKGGALNAIQIAEKILTYDYL